MVVGYKDFMEKLEEDIQQRNSKVIKDGIQILANFEKDPEKTAIKMHENLRLMGYVDALRFMQTQLKNYALGYDMEDLKQIEKNYDESTSENNDNNIQ